MSTVQYVCLLLIIVPISLINSAKILGIFTIASVSHQIVFQPIWRELSLRGHQVTVLTPNPLKDPTLTNLTEIDLSFMYKNIEEMKPDFAKVMDHWTMLRYFTSTFLTEGGKLLKHDKLQTFIKNGDKSYDVVLIEIMDPLTLAIAAKFKCPLIGVSSVGVINPVHVELGNPVHPILHPDFIAPNYKDQLSFFEKVDAVLFDLYFRYRYHYNYLPTVNSIAREYLGDDIPDVRGVQKNMSMLFVNTNPVIYGVRPYGTNVVEFGGGIHIKPAKPLPSELKSFLDNANEGVIYFSLGSNVKSIYLSEDKRNILIQAFAKLPYKVLWKFEDDQMEGKPENVKINKWLPQQDILRHPNIKLFITQAGYQSTEEGLLNGVPMLALPFIGDQTFNAKVIKHLGVGLHLHFPTLTEENFISAILKITNNPKYKSKAEEIGRLMKDQPMTGLEKVVWWTEYVIRNQGATYLRNHRADVSWSEFLILDVVIFFVSILILVFFLIYKTSRCISRLIFKSLQFKLKTQ